MRTTLALFACLMLLMGTQRVRAQSEESSLLKLGLEELKGKSAEIRADGAQTLGDLGPKGATAVPALVNALTDSNAEVRGAVADALGKIGAQPTLAVPALIEGFNEKDLDNVAHCSAAVAAYATKNPTGLLPKIRATLKDASRRFGALMTLALMGKAATPAQADVLALMDDPAAKVRVASAEALGAIGTPVETSVPALVKALKDPDAEVRTAAADALNEIGAAASTAFPALETALKDTDRDVRLNAALAIAKMPGKAAVAVPGLAEALTNDDQHVRANAEDVLGQIGAPAAPAVPALIPAIKDVFPSVARRAEANIRRIAEALVVQKKALSVEALQKTIADLETALHAIAASPRKTEEYQKAQQESQAGISEAQFQLREELKSRSPHDAAVAEKAAPARHDLAEARRLIRQAEQMASKVSGKELRVSALEDVAMAKAQASDYEGARLMARALGTAESKEKILRKMAVQQIYDENYDESLKIIDGIASADSKIQGYALVVDTLVDLGKNTAALTAIEYAQAVKLPNGDGGIFDFLLIGRAFARAGNPEKTSAMASAIKSGGIAADAVKATLFTLAKAYNHDLAGARAKYAGIRLAPFQLLALEAIVEVQLKAGDKAGATAAGKQLIEVVQAEPAVPIDMILHLAHIQHTNGDTPGAQATIQIALDTALKKADALMLSEIVGSQTEIGDIDGALKTMAQIKTPADQAAARKAIASAKAKSGDVTGALAMASADADAFCQTEVLVGTTQGILESLKPLPKP